MANQYANERVAYEAGERLLEQNAPADPMDLFAVWYADAAASQGVIEPNAMSLATADAEGRPAVRTVLLKGADARGFSFFGNYNSRKGREIELNPWVALNFWWPPLQRQVRVEGSIARLPAAESDEYYDSRPRGSRLGAWVSPQSQPIPDRTYLEDRLAALENEYAEHDPKRPPTWGGWLVSPQSIEFWQGAPYRLHDRLRYTRASGDGGWTIQRLAP